MSLTTLRKVVGGPDSERFRQIIVGLLGLTTFIALSTLGVQWSFGAFDDNYRLVGRFDAAGQGLAIGSDVKVRGVNIGKVAGIELAGLDALVKLDIDGDERIPRDARAVVRPKTLFGEKFIDIETGENEAEGPFLSDGDAIEDTLGGFELEQVLSDLYPILRAIDPAELTVVLGELADAGQGLGPVINRSIVSFQQITQVYAENDPNTRQILRDFALLADELDARAEDLVAAARDLNVALPDLNARGDQLGDLLEGTATLSRDLADLFDANRSFLRTALDEGSQPLQILSDEQARIQPLLVGLRKYTETVSAVVRIPLGDGTMLAAVKAITGGGEPCGQGLGESCLIPQSPVPLPVPPPTVPPTTVPPVPPVTVPPITVPSTIPGVTVPPLPVPSRGSAAVTDLLGGMLR